jgi:hypothetical protein
MDSNLLLLAEIAIQQQKIEIPISEQNPQKIEVIRIPKEKRIRSEQTLRKKWKQIKPDSYPLPPPFISDVKVTVTFVTILKDNKDNKTEIIC